MKIKFEDIFWSFMFFVIVFALAMVMLLGQMGCSTNRETIIKDKVLEVKVPEVDLKLQGKIIADSLLKVRIEDFFSTLPDTTYVEGSAVTIDTTGHVIKTDVKFYPNRKKNPVTKKPGPGFQLNVKHSDIQTRYTDTVIINPPKKEGSPWEKVKTIGFIIALILIGLKVYTFFKK